MLNQIQLKMLEEVQRWNEDVQKPITFPELTSWCSSYKIADFYEARPLLIKLIKEDYLKCGSTNQVDFISPLTITRKGKRALSKANPSKLRKAWKLLSNKTKVLVSIVSLAIVEEVISQLLTQHWGVIIGTIIKLVN